ncbi:MAG: 3-dehydroquinate dehydratase [Bacteriovoracales bacterium]|nr:3-dehydroquinate dehydratase [Bacteriovoracales bacterium]
MKKILVINGPNLNLLSIREPDLYGQDTLEEIKIYTEGKLTKEEVSTTWFQSNREADILEKIQSDMAAYDGIVLNPGSLGHSSFALYDCIRGLPCRVVEVHLTNTHGREDFRSDRMSARVCLGVIEGLGKDVYYLGVLSLLNTR